MKQLLLATSALCLAASGASAQTGNLSGASVTATGSTTPRTLADRAADAVNVRDWFAGTAANCATDVAPAVNAAVTAGVRRIFLPANCKYIPTGNTTPANTSIIGEDWQTSIIKSSDPSLNVFLGSNASAINVGVIDNFCTTQALVGHGGTAASVCPNYYGVNISDTPTALLPWIYSLASVTLQPTHSPDGIQATDVSGWSCTDSTTGDCFYGQSTGAGGAARFLASGNNDHGILLLSGMFGSQNNKHIPLFIKDLSNATGSALAESLRIDRVGDGTNVTQSMQIDDIDATGSSYTSIPLAIALAHQTGGDFMDFYQTTTTFSGNGHEMNFGNGGGSFTGKFVDYKVAGVTQFAVDAAGHITTNGGIAGTAANDNASTGYVGQFVTAAAIIGAPVALSTGIAADVISISLTAGDWDVWASLGVVPAGTTTTSSIQGGINIVSATMPASASTGFASWNNPLAAGKGQMAPIGQVRLSLSTTTTVYMVANVQFAVSTAAGYGTISARRMR